MKNVAYTVLVASIAVLGAASSALAGAKSVDSPTRAYYMYRVENPKAKGSSNIDGGTDHFAFCLYRVTKANPKGVSTKADFIKARPVTQYFADFADVTDTAYLKKNGPNMTAFHLDLLIDEIASTENVTTAHVDTKLADTIVAKTVSHARAELGVCPVQHPRAK